MKKFAFPVRSLTQAKRQKGVTMIEYALIAALIAVVAIVAIGKIGNGLNTTFGNIATKLNGS